MIISEYPELLQLMVTKETWVLKNLNNGHLEALLEIAKAATRDLYIDDILRLIVNRCRSCDKF